MEGKKSKPRAILVFGAPASGKTTFCERFSKQFRAPYYNLTEIGKERGFDRDTLLFVLRLCARSQQNMIIEGEVNTAADRDELRHALEADGYNTNLVWIQTDVNTIKSRLKAKLKSVAKAREEYDNGIAELEAPNDEEGPIVLSGKQTFEMQVSQLLSQLL